jgi:YbbR domain-containing protein
MTRLVRLVVYNWPLKLGAIVLASLLYGGLVLSQSAQTYRGSIPIERVNQASDVTVLSNLGAVTSIEYIVPGDLGFRIDSSTFRATVDLDGVDPGARTISLPVRVSPSDPRIQILDFAPRTISVNIDRLTSRSVPVRPVVVGTIPTGFDLGDPVVDASQAVVAGPDSVVADVVEVQARVTIDPSGIDVDRTVDLIPVDANGDALIGVDVAPRATRVRIAVFTDRRTRTLPVNPVVTGTPAAGFEVASVTVEPLVVSVEGDANDLAGLEQADTWPLSITGASSDTTATVALDLPDGVQALGSGSVFVTVHLRPVTATRTFEAGLVLVGANAGLTYTLSTDRVLITIGGPVAELDRLSGATLALTLDVSGLGDGPHEVAPQANLTTGLSLIAIVPSPVIVTITSPPASPEPSPTG